MEFPLLRRRDQRQQGPDRAGQRDPGPCHGVPSGQEWGWPGAGRHRGIWAKHHRQRELRRQRPAGRPGSQRQRPWRVRLGLERRNRRAHRQGRPDRLRPAGGEAHRGGRVHAGSSCSADEQPRADRCKPDEPGANHLEPGGWRRRHAAGSGRHGREHPGAHFIRGRLQGRRAVPAHRGWQGGRAGAGRHRVARQGPVAGIHLQGGTGPAHTGSA